MLTYKKALDNQFYADLEIDVPKNWGLESSQGNQALRRKGLSLIKKLEKLSEKNALKSLYVAALEQFYLSVKDTKEGKIYKGIKNNSVDKVLVDFLYNCAESLSLDTDAVNSIIKRV